MRSPALTTVVATIADELRALGMLAQGLQDGPGPASIGDPGSVERLQSLDLLTQRLAELARFMAALAPCVPLDCRADLTAALGAVTLAELQRRLAALPVQVGAEAGSLELFGT